MPPKRVKTRPAAAPPNQPKNEAEQELSPEPQQPRTPAGRPREAQDQPGKAGAAQVEQVRTNQQDTSHNQQHPGQLLQQSQRRETAAEKTRDARNQREQGQVMQQQQVRTEQQAVSDRAAQQQIQRIGLENMQDFLRVVACRARQQTPAQEGVPTSQRVPDREQVPTSQRVSAAQEFPAQPQMSTQLLQSRVQWLMSNDEKDELDVLVTEIRSTIPGLQDKDSIRWLITAHQFGSWPAPVQQIMARVQDVIRYFRHLKPATLDQAKQRKRLLEPADALLVNLYLTRGEQFLLAEEAHQRAPSALSPRSHACNAFIREEIHQGLINPGEGSRKWGKWLSQPQYQAEFRREMDKIVYNFLVENRGDHSPPPLSQEEERRLKIANAFLAAWNWSAQQQQQQIPAQRPEASAQHQQRSAQLSQQQAQLQRQYNELIGMVKHMQVMGLLSPEAVGWTLKEWRTNPGYRPHLKCELIEMVETFRQNDPHSKQPGQRAFLESAERFLAMHENPVQRQRVPISQPQQKQPQSSPAPPSQLQAFNALLKK
jgi:hypothetical protein